MMENNDKRLIEDYLPIVAISAEASREKSVRKGHISTLHLWWARRPLVACRAAVYGALVPASQFVPNGGTDAQKKSLGRANAAKFITSLCQYPGSPQVIKEAQAHILKAHAERLTQELRSSGRESAPTSPSENSQSRLTSAATPAWIAEFKWPAANATVTVEDIVAGRAPRPRVLDMFAGGGAIPLEALRLGCEAYALDLNPVAHIIQLCTLVYPQKFGKPDPNARGMTGPKNDKSETTWGGLADEVRYWGTWMLEKVRAEIGDLYPLIPDPEFTPPKKRKGGKDDDAFAEPQHVMGFADDAQQRLKARTGFLNPVAYLWTRTVQCKNPSCGATVPLVKQTWLRKNEGHYVALKMIAPKGQKRVRFEVVEARSTSALGFDPEAFSEAGNAACPFCGTVADSDYVKVEGCAKRMKKDLMAVVCRRPEGGPTIYLTGSDMNSEVSGQARLVDARRNFPTEPMDQYGMSGFRVQPYGMTRWGDIYGDRQGTVLHALTKTIRRLESDSEISLIGAERIKAIRTLLALAADRLANYLTELCVWRSNRTCVLPTFSRQAVPMVWDFGEMNPFAGSAGDWSESVEYVSAALDALAALDEGSNVQRSSALSQPYSDSSIDALITDPPYYDNVSYANISDFFYVWLKRSISDLYPEHLVSDLTPKKQEAIANLQRDGGKERARIVYEQMMSKAFAEAFRVLKTGSPMIVVYAHKTTGGWATLVDALRKTGFQVTEAWPISTEMTGGMRTELASLASSIFLVARKRDGAQSGNYDEQVRPELEEIVRERVETLWDMGISGADLVIASVGAGLRAFTRFARVEYANGEEVPAERFLTEVETVVLETILARLSKEVGPACASHADRGKGGTSLAGLDPASRFYILWRYTYGAAELDAGEAIIFANGTHVELDGQHGLTGGNDALVEKKKSKYRLRDFAERGGDENLGLPSEDGQSAPLVDTLHRTLWLMEKRPHELTKFLRDAQPNREALRLVAQALAGPALKGGELDDVSPTAELSALGKLTANWQSVIEDAAQTTGEKEERKKGQKQLI